MEEVDDVWDSLAGADGAVKVEDEAGVVRLVEMCVRAMVSALACPPSPARPAPSWAARGGLAPLPPDLLLHVLHRAVPPSSRYVLFSFDFFYKFINMYNATR